MTDTFDRRLGRRDFLKSSAAATVGLAAGLPGSAHADEAAGTVEPGVKQYRELGRTGLRISDISFGASRLGADGDELVRRALDLGVNYFDTAESYTGGRSEETIGRALGPDREKVYLTSKVKCDVGTTEDELMTALEASLRRLRTDRVEVYFNHAVNDPDRMKNEAWYSFTDKAKQQGKIRFTGMSGHAGRLIECLDYVVDAGKVDVLLVGYNFGQDPAFYETFTRSFDRIATQPELPRVLEKAHAKGIGTIAMKTLMGARKNDLRAYERPGGTFAQAALRWVLGNADVDALIISMKTKEMIDEYLAASGSGAPSRRDVRLLERYVARNGASYCRHGCNLCEGSCPAGVDISEVLRTRMYAVDYGDPELGRTDYAALGDGARACSSCSGAPCAGACPNGLDIAAMTREAETLLRA